ncbi:MAG: hypothetical protein H2058_16200 [Muricauda sp.]|nr:hypothetical protein [Allomuricauda sp.]MBA4746789.1 hypothetical protein [Allomuricauda sp.]
MNSLYELIKAPFQLTDNNFEEGKKKGATKYEFFYLSDIDPVTTGGEGFALLGIARKGCTKSS